MPKYEKVRMMAANTREITHQEMEIPNSISMIEDAKVPPAETKYTDSRL